MSNTINWGKIYEKTAWGIGVVTNTISWGKIYATLAGPIPSFALDFVNIANDFTFTRSSFATRVNEFGLIETVTDLGSELVTNGSFDTDSDWSNNGNWSVGNGVATYDGLSSIKRIYQTVNFVQGKTYKISFDITNTEDGFIELFFGQVATTLISKTTYSVGSYEFYVEANSTSQNLSIYAYNTSYGGGSIDNVSVKEVLEDDVPRIDYTNGEAEFLLEPQSTNLVTYSEDFSQWTVNGTLTSNAGISPDGTQNADLLDAISIKGRLGQDVTLLPATDYTVSMYVKASTTSGFTKFRIYEIDSASFTLSQVVTSQLIVGEWVRVTLSFTSNLGGLCQVRLLEDLPIGENAYVYGAQLEALPYATSYIPTNGTTVTRSAELCVDATPTINSAEGVLYFEGSALVETDSVTNRHIALSNGATLNNRLYFYLSQSGKFGFASFVGGVLQANITFDGVVTDNSKVACKWKENDYALWVNGVEVGTDNLASVWTANTLNTLNFSDPLGADVFYGNTKDLKIYDKALTDDELITLTTI